MRAIPVLVLTAALVVGLPGVARSQTGTVTGVVTDARSVAPVSAAQVHIPGLQVGTLTQANGRFLLLNVPPGTHTLQVIRIGYRTETQEVTVSAGQASEVNLSLTEDALELDELVVTGTAGQARRREVGNQIVQVNIDEVAEPVTNVGQLLQGRVAGARIASGGGSSGGGMDIRLRGNVSVSMSNQPLIYVDGIRVKSEPYPRLASDDYPSPLNDINPDDIERVEIVKGPAATTLYGTEAAAGVIQIFTKRGATGAPQWTAETQQGFSYMRPFATDEVPYFYIDPVLRNGHRQRYNISVRGGASDRLGYFASASWDDNDGVVDKEWQKQVGLRGNMTFQPHEDLLIQFNNSLNTTDLRNQIMGNSITGIMMAGMRGDRGYMRSRRSETLRLLLDAEYATSIDRFVSGATFSYTPSGSFTHRLTVGYDFSQYEKNEITPYDWRTPAGVLGDLGTIERTSSQNTLTSIDYVGNLAFDLTSNLRSTFSWGFQGVENREERLTADGDDFPGPGDYTITSTARQSSSQSLIKVITGGFFFQDMFALSDRYFLTLGLRVDGNSAFGEALGLEPYPKASFSYVLSDETFWPESLGSMKLRAAYGLAGRAPGAFDKVRTWQPVGFGLDRAAFTPENLGNPNLGPERTAELELGFDASALRERVTAEFTYFRRNTTDALFEVNAPAVQGGWNAQLENVGEIRTSGIELGVNARVLDFRSFGWDVGAALSTNNSEVISLGGAPEFSVGNRAWIIEGQPVPVFRGYKLMNFWDKADPIIEEDQIIGPGYPPHIVNLNTSLRLPGGIMISGRGEYVGRHYIWHIPEAAVLDRAVPYPTCYDAYRKVEPGWEVGPIGGETPNPGSWQGRPGSEDLYAWERAKCFGLMQPARYDLVITPLNYFELRDLTLSIPVSSLLPSLTGWSERTDLTVSARNLWYWRNRELMAGHPEGLEGGNTASNELVRRLGETLPPASYFTVSLRAVF